LKDISLTGTADYFDGQLATDGTNLENETTGTKSWNLLCLRLVELQLLWGEHLLYPEDIEGTS
jgi:hypothetical protein